MRTNRWSSAGGPSAPRSPNLRPPSSKRRSASCSGCFTLSSQVLQLNHGQWSHTLYKGEQPLYARPSSSCCGSSTPTSRALQAKSPRRRCTAGHIPNLRTLAARPSGRVSLLPRPARAAVNQCIHLWRNARIRDSAGVACTPRPASLFRIGGRT